MAKRDAGAMIASLHRGPTDDSVPSSSIKKEKGKRQSSREGMTFAGFYINDQARDQMIDLVHAQKKKHKKNNQDLYREAMNLLFRHYGMDEINYD